jgi:hypothetical protein
MLRNNGLAVFADEFPGELEFRHVFVGALGALLAEGARLSGIGLVAPLRMSRNRIVVLLDLSGLLDLRRGLLTVLNVAETESGGLLLAIRVETSLLVSVSYFGFCI